MVDVEEGGGVLRLLLEGVSKTGLSKQLWCEEIFNSRWRDERSLFKAFSMSRFRNLQSLQLYLIPIAPEGQAIPSAS